MEEVFFTLFPVTVSFFSIQNRITHSIDTAWKWKISPKGINTFHFSSLGEQESAWHPPRSEAAHGEDLTGCPPGSATCTVI